VKEIRSRIRKVERAAIVPQTLEHIVGARARIGALPLRYFGHLLLLCLAAGVAFIGGFGKYPSALASLPDRTSATLPTAFGQPKGGLQDDLLIKAPAPVTTLVNRPREGMVTHTVAEGESVGSIADKYAISANTVMWANDIDELSTISPGQVLLILPVSGVLHRVRSGETIEDIAWKYQSDVRAIVEFNQLTDPSDLMVDEPLIVPGGRQEERPRALLASRSTQRPPEDDEADAPKQVVLKPSTYQVASGDTLSEIADKFGVSQATLIAANNLGADPDALKLGQELTILPVSGVMHTVGEGESIGAIATRYDVEVEEIVKTNGIEDAHLVAAGRNLVIPGATISIAKPQPAPAPAPAQVASVSHVVQPGESLMLIAERYGVNPARIVQANTIRDADVVAVGQKLDIPGGRAQTVAVQPAPRTAASAPAPAAKPTPAAVAAKPAPAPAPAPAAAAAPADEGAGWNIVSIASKYLGYRYTWGGVSPNTGFDCSGFSYYVYRTAGRPVPRDLWGQMQAGPRIKQANLLPGDIVFFENTYTAGLSHNGIYIGGGRFIHAASEREGVKVSSLSESYWAARYYGASRPW
jgi:peptidoglycan endopeptidase LytE